MSNPVIQVENLSKYYRLGLIGGGTLHEDINRWIAKVRGKPDPLLMIDDKDHGNRKDGQIWALRDINLEVNEGEILGIIGRNGAGKSTLLKILSKITAPTEGRIKIKGRVGSLLEVGTGFHPELTGRENIYLNGTILGMRHAEVSSKLEEIVEFAEMAKFIDTPVKRYSSGMRVRLAFAVAAHLEPEILVIDEVLAVGDAAFQKKCLGKMKDVAGHGRTILFVSHNLPSIITLCTKAMLLENGLVQGIGETKEIIQTYMGEAGKHSAIWVNEENNLDDVVLQKIELCGNDGNIRSEFLNTEAIFVKLGLVINNWHESLKIGISLTKDIEGVVFSIFHNDFVDTNAFFKLENGNYTFIVEIPSFFLNSGTYCVSVLAGSIEKTWNNFSKTTMENYEEMNMQLLKSSLKYNLEYLV
jgi:lipopolysaccharide transport system ATP-binding protein